MAKNTDTAPVVSTDTTSESKAPKRAPLAVTDWKIAKGVVTEGVCTKEVTVSHTATSPSVPVFISVDFTGISVETLAKAAMKSIVIDFQRAMRTAKTPEEMASYVASTPGEPVTFKATEAGLSPWADPSAGRTTDPLAKGIAAVGKMTPEQKAAMLAFLTDGTDGDEA